MTFNTALSGLRAANTDLAVTGNNIANTSTVGFKESRTEFGDVYANAILGSGSKTAGSGVLVTDISQQFNQGNISFTDNTLDMAINGVGFFVLSKDGSLSYTRAGQFGLDNSGFIVSNDGARVQGFPVNTQGAIAQGVLSDIRVQTQDLTPRTTQNVDLRFTLDSRQSVPIVPTFDPTDTDSFNSSTSLTVYDSLGNPHIMTSYFVKTATPNQWNMHVQIDDQNVGGTTGTPAMATFPIEFNSDGSLNMATLPSISIDNWDPANGAFGPANGGAPTQPPTSSNFVVNIAGSTQFGQTFSVANADQDGFAPGRLTGLEIDDSGVVFARYTNGESLVLAQVALANFDNPQGLNPLGNTAWAESFQSGEPVIGAPQSGALGAIQSGALEDSNVDLSEQLVQLIIAQRNFQANAKTIETADTVTQAIINLR